MLNLTHLRYLLEDARSHYYYSGYHFYAESPIGKIRLWGGVTSYWPQSMPITPDVHFDIGSLTKVIFTTSVLASAVDGKTLKLSDTVGRYVAGLAPTPFAGQTIGSLLAHSSGLAPWRAYYERPIGIVDWLASEHGLQTSAPNSRAQYSDIGFWLLGLVLEAVFSETLEKIFETHIARPFQLQCLFRPKAVSSAATEYCLWRNRLLQGEVFDENCASQGGIGAHAGLFAPAQGIAPLVRAWLDAWKGDGKWISQNTARLFTRPSNLVPGSSWAYGWDTQSAKNSSAGGYFSPQSFGHLGYPGCSIWIDPAASGFVIFFTNRIHPSRVDERIRKLRPLVHDEVAQLWRERRHG